MNNTPCESRDSFGCHGDPTLDSCCQRERDLREKVESYKERLSASDPTAVRRRIAERAVVRAANEVVVSEQPAGDDEAGDDLAGDDEEEILRMLREQRLAELRKEARRDAAAADVELVEEEDVLASLNQPSSSPLLCCLVQPDFSRKEDVTECLRLLASESRVVVCRLQPHSPVPRVLGWHEPTTVVLVLRDKTVVASVAVLEDGWRNEDLLKSVREGIERTGTMGPEDEHDEDKSPCAVCGRRYLHAHIVS